MSERLENPDLMKYCTKCQEPQTLEDFHINKDKKDGRSTWCKSCVSTNGKEWRQRNLEKCRAQSRQWHQENRERVNAIRRKRYRDNPQESKVSNNKWREENPDKVLACRKRRYQREAEKIAPDKNLRRAYGISLDEYNEMITDQKGNCAMCGLTMEDEKNRPPVDHDHSKTGLESVRGIVHTKCNLLIGIVEDNPDVLDKAREYLMRYSLKGI